jgi:hypothetical protein
MLDASKKKILRSLAVAFLRKYCSAFQPVKWSLKNLTFHRRVAGVDFSSAF